MFLWFAITAILALRAVYFSWIGARERSISASKLLATWSTFSLAFAFLFGNGFNID